MREDGIAPPSLRQVLRTCREVERDHYLLLREAFLALYGTREEIIREGKTWLPSLCGRSAEVVRVHFGPAGGKRAGMTLEFNIRGRDRETLHKAPELHPKTRTLVGNGTADRLRLRVKNEDDLAEGLALAMLLIPAAAH
jgi:hypothetical protein